MITEHSAYSGVTPDTDFPKMANVTKFIDTRGKVRWRYRKKGFTACLGSNYGSELFMLKVEAARRGEKLTMEQACTHVTKSMPGPGSISVMIDSWYQSEHFQRLSASTQYGYKQQAEGLRADYGNKLVKDMKCQDIVAIMAAKADRPNAANHDRLILNFVFDRAVHHGYIQGNVARDVKKLPALGGGYHVWTEAEIAQFIATHPLGTVPHTTLMLMLHTGAGRSDVTTFGPDNIKVGRLRYSRPKCLDRLGVEVDIPLTSELLACIEPLMTTKTFLQTTTGKRRSPNGLGNAMQTWCNDAGLKNCTSQGLRKACARRIGEAGLYEQPIAAVLGYVSTTTPHKQLGMSDRSYLADLAIGSIGRTP